MGKVECHKFSQLLVLLHKPLVKSWRATLRTLHINTTQISMSETPKLRSSKQTSWCGGKKRRLSIFKKIFASFRILNPKHLDTTAGSEEEIATRRYNAKVSAGALEENAAQERMQATLNRMYGKTARRAGQIKATTTLLNQAAESTKLGMFG